jgi:hypothetical protein
MEFTDVPRLHEMIRSIILEHYENELDELPCDHSLLFIFRNKQASRNGVDFNSVKTLLCDHFGKKGISCKSDPFGVVLDSERWIEIMVPEFVNNGSRQKHFVHIRVLSASTARNRLLAHLTEF